MDIERRENPLKVRDVAFRTVRTHIHISNLFLF